MSEVSKEDLIESVDNLLEKIYDIWVPDSETDRTDGEILKEIIDQVDNFSEWFNDV